MSEQIVTIWRAGYGFHFDFVVQSVDAVERPKTYKLVTSPKDQRAWGSYGSTAAKDTVDLSPQDAIERARQKVEIQLAGARERVAGLEARLATIDAYEHQDARR